MDGLVAGKFDFKRKEITERRDKEFVWKPLKKRGIKARRLLGLKEKKTRVSWTRIMRSSTRKKRKRKKNNEQGNGKRLATHAGVSRSAFPSRDKANDELCLTA